MCFSARAHGMDFNFEGTEVFLHLKHTVFSSVECVFWSGWGGCNDLKLSCASVLGGWSGMGWGIGGCCDHVLTPKKPRNVAH